jgi:hypothetical protein
LYSGSCGRGVFRLNTRFTSYTFPQFCAFDVYNLEKIVLVAGTIQERKLKLFFIVIMMYSKKEFPQYVKTAGKITVATALTGLLVFVVAFMFDAGSRELSKVSAQTASTTLTVLNTPPVFTVNAYEATDSTIATPTNSDSEMVWEAVGTDSNGAPYFLLICSSNSASPTANAAVDIFSLGTEPPECGAGITWGVSTSTNSGTLARVATTTFEGGSFSTTTPNDWYAWVCDDDPEFPACNPLAVQGPTSTVASTSPFYINSRPVLTNFYNGGPFVPGTDLEAMFLSTSSDPDALGGQDDIFLVVCQAPGWATSTDTCLDPADFLASTTIATTDNATSSFTIPLPIQDDNYPAYAYLVDEHGHEALANGLNQDYTIANAAPYVTSGDIVLNDGDDLILTNPGGQTTGFTLDVKVKDYNGCLTAASTTDEIKGFYALVYRNGTSSACDAESSTYDPNNCYTNAFASSSAWTVPTTTWAISCVATSTCASPLQDEMDYRCTFPLWFVAEPTLDTGTSTLPAFLSADYWTAGIIPFDNNYATGTQATSTFSREVYPLTALDVLSEEIAYGALKPGENNPTLSATSTVVSIGNTGIDNEIKGDSMCDSYSPGSPCANDPTATIPESEQQFGDASYAYDTIGPVDFPNIALSSSSYQEVELNIFKPTSTVFADAPQGTTYWGIRVPGSITKSGSYTGMNTFTAVTAEPADWY